MSAPMPHEIGSDNIDEVKAAISEWEEICAAAEGGFDDSYRVLLALESRLDELESRDWYADQREQRRDYFSRVL